MKTTFAVTATAAALLALTACDSGGSQAAQSTVTVGVEATTTNITRRITTTQAPPTPSTVTVTVGGSSSTPAQGSPSAPQAPAPSSTSDAPSSSPASAEDPSPSSTCATTTARQARDNNVGKVPMTRDYAWDTSGTDGLEGYDQCKALSWIVLGIKGATASSPFSVMMYHQGDYIGRASAINFGFYPQVKRVDDHTITITYTYPKDGESNAGASGRATSTFVWDESQGKVVQSGEWPPQG